MLKMYTVFQQYPIPSHQPLYVDWFNLITSHVAKFQRIDARPHSKVHEPALVAWKDAGNGPQEYENVTIVTFDQLYIAVLRQLSDNFTVENLPGLIDDLIDIRTIAKSAGDHIVVTGVKHYLNMIFGQLAHGPIQHATCDGNDVVRMAREQVQKLYDHPQAFYADTDIVMFTGDIATIESHLATLNLATFNLDGFRVSIERVNKVTIRGKKRLEIN